MKFKWFISEKFLLEDEIFEISELAHHAVNMGTDRSSIDANKTSKVKVLSWSTLSKYKSKIENAIYHINHENFGFNLYKITDFDSVNYNRYESVDHGEYEWHRDAVQHDTYDIKLTVVINVSKKPFEGGKFELFSYNTVSIDPLSYAGSLLIFPSMFEHRVLPVTSGVRETISIWVKGPHFT